MAKITNSYLLFMVAEKDARDVAEVLSRVLSEVRRWEDGVSLKVRVVKPERMRGLQVPQGEVGIFIEVSAERSNVLAVTLESLNALFIKELTLRIIKSRNKESQDNA